MASNPDFVKNRLSFAVNVMGFGADATGATDSRAAFEAAIAACKGRDYATLLVPAGIYKIGVDAGGEGVGLLIERLSGLCIRGDGALRSHSQEDEFVGTTIRFEPNDDDPPLVGLLIRACPGLRIENLNIHGAADPNSANRTIGVRIESIDEGGTVGTTAIQFQNVAFRWCDVCVQTTSANLNNSEFAFYDCIMEQSRIGFQPQWNQSLVHKFYGLTGGANDEADSGGMECMFDLTFGGNVTCIGFGGQNIHTFVRVGAGGGNIGWNEFINTRLEQMTGWGNEHRTKIYEAVAAGGSTHGQHTQFDGIVITPPGQDSPKDDGTTRFSLMEGHTVILRNASRAATYQFATAASKLVDFPDISPHARGGTLRCFNVTVPFDARLDRDDVPANAKYSFTECNDDNAPYPDLLHPPLYGPNYLMAVEYHCWEAGEALVGVREETANAGNVVVPVAPSDELRFGVLACSTELVGYSTLISFQHALKPGSSIWRFQAAARVTALASGEFAEFEVRLGFNSLASGEGDDGVFFRYRNTENGDRWEGVIRWGGSEGALDTGVAKDEAWHTFEIELRESGDQATFYIDGVRLGTASESPTEGGPTGLMPLQFVRLGGSGTKAAEIDYYKYEIRPSGPSPMYPE